MRRRELLATTKDTTAGSVDLGLSVKWAEGNIVKNGTEYSIGTPTSRGCYFSWGNVEGYNDGERYDFSKKVYESTPGYNLTADISPTSGYDAARVTIGGNWRLPTKAECQELISNCTCEFTTQDNVDGMRFKSKKRGYTDNSIFIPASGYFYGTSFEEGGAIGYYLSSTFYSGNNAYNLYFDSDNLDVYYVGRAYGWTVRAVQ